MSIYLQHFAFKREPFSIVPDPGFLYPSIYHRQAVAHLKYGLDREGGFILLTGEVGTGKTTLTRTMIKRIPPHVRVAYILNSKLNTADVLASICDELNIELPADTELSFTKKCIDALYRDLLAAHAEGKKTLIIIEEAHNLSPEVLETLRLLSNLETSTQKLLYILLVGQPELLEILSQMELRQLNQRVVSRFHLSPLDKNDLSNYINHRLHRAGAKQAIFEPACIAVLFKLTGGVPRLINLVCHQALVAAYASGEKTISAKLVSQAAAEILGDEKKSSSQRPAVIAATLVLFAVATVTAVAFKDRLPIPADATVAKEAAAPVKAALPEQAEVVSLPAVEGEAVDPQRDSVEVVQQPESLQSKTIQPKPPLANPYSRLLARWGINSVEVYSEEELYSVADLQQLRMEKAASVSLNFIEKTNRPGIVWMLGEQGYLRAHVLSGLTVDTVTLQYRQGTLQIPREQFNQNWNGTYLYLWKPPQGYSGPLSANGNILNGQKINPQVVDWLQKQLQLIDQSTELVISGGRYTQAVASQVLEFQRQQQLVADGILGRETLMRINQFSGEGIPLLRENN